MNYDISVIAPCFNEESNLEELVQRLKEAFETAGIRGEIVLVNDGSRDNTGVLIDAFSKRDADIRPVHHPVNRGMVQGWKSGLANASGEYVCLIDADLQNLPEDVCRLYREIRFCKADVVQGVRSSIGRLKDSRYTLSRGLNILLNACFSMRLRDNKSGFFICRKEVLAEILRYRFDYGYFQTFVMVAAHSKGFTIREIETIFESRLAGKSFIPALPLKVIGRVLRDIVLAVYEFRISKKTKTVLGEYLTGKAAEKVSPTMTGWRRAWFRFYCWTMPLHAWLISRDIKTYYDELQKSQWLSPAEIKELQELKLRKVVHHAYHHVGYYRQIFDSLGLTPADICTIEDLQKLPLLDKPMIRKHLHFDLLSDNYDKKKILKISTSGSTGEPFVCYADKFQLEMRWASTLRSMEWTGYRFGDPQARLWHQTIGMRWSQIIREYLDAWMNRRIFIPAYEMSDRNIDKAMERLQRHKPTLIDGYAESFNLLAHHIKNKGLKGVTPKGIISSAQILPEQSRAIIQEEFGCGAFDKYGSREFSGIAYESDAHDGHLVVAESYIVEILKDGRPAAPGELGEVVITDLNNLCMPFIRYRVGDLAVQMDNSRPSPCGRGLPRIGRIEGRVQAIIFGTNGNYVPGTFFAHLFKDYDHAVRQYQVIQEQLGAITLKIIKAPRFTEDAFEEILGQLRHFLGKDMNIDVRFVDHIELVRTGKHQGAISRLKFDFQKTSGDGPMPAPGAELKSPVLERT